MARTELLHVVHVKGQIPAVKRLKRRSDKERISLPAHVLVLQEDSVI